MIYGINDSPKTIKEWILYPSQQVLSVFVATVLIATICGTPVNAALFAGGLGTLIYLVLTSFKSPMFISSCGATVSAVIAAKGMTPNNYISVVIGGIVILIIYSLFALIIAKKGTAAIDKLLPPIIIGPITMVIGINLAAFIGSYTQVNGGHNDWGIIMALITMIIVALSSHYFKGFWRTIPFLIGLLGGYGIAAILTLTNVVQLIDFTLFKNLKVFSLPDFTFLQISLSDVSWTLIGKIILIFAPVAVCAICEHYSDHKVLSNIINVDLTKTPGLHRTLIGDGVASLVGTITSGLPNTSYGESIATTGFSQVASVKVIACAAITLCALSFIQPVQVFLNSIPACVFGGCAMVLYGYIFASGLKTLMNSKTDLENNKNLIVVSVILTIGVSGIYLFNEAFAGVSLAMVAGVVLNKIMK